jgi:hypothetical protein
MREDDGNMGNRLRTRLFVGTLLGLLGIALLWTGPGLAAGQPSPATEESPITVHANCVREGRKLRINYTVRSWEPELTAPVVEVWFEIDGGRREPLPPGSFEPGQEEFSGHFLIDAPAEEGSTLVIIARAHWTDPTEKSITKKSSPLPLPVCTAETTTTTTPSSSTAPTTTTGPTTTTSAVGGATSTTSGGQLPFTGTSSAPTGLVGLGLLIGGALMLWTTSRTRAGRQSK